MNKLTFSILTVILVLSILLATWMQHETVVSVSHSPDGQYLLVVLKRNVLSIPVMPGQGSDAECSVELREKGSCRLIARKKVALLQNIEQIQWAAGKVWINPHCAISYEGSALGIW